jgi:tetratricopeptide (TPR) repeat protein
MKEKLLRLFKSAAATPAAATSPVVPVAEQIERARELHQRREHEAAASLYRGILAAFPGSAEAHYRYGNLLKDQGAFEEALGHYDQAVGLKSDYAHAWCNRAVVLGFLQRLADARASYDRAIAIDPADAIAHCNRAMVLVALAEKDAALAGFDAAIAQDARSFAAHSGRGALLQERKQWAAALSAYDQAIAINPGDAATHYNRGTVLKELRQFTAALSSYERAIAANPEFARAHAMRAEVLQELGQLPVALQSYDRAIELDARDATNYNNRAVLLQKMTRLEEALAAYDCAIALRPDYADAWFNRGTLLSELDDTDAALGSYARAIAARPDFADAYVNRGLVLDKLGQIQAARSSYEQAIAIKHDLPEAHFNRSLAALILGDFATGWAAYEWRWRAKGGPIFREKRDFAASLWLGKGDIAGKTLLLYGEQGLGDSLLFCRYVELVAKLGPRIILEVPPPLLSVCNTLSGVAQVVPYGSPLPDFDLQCPLMSLPLAFDTTLETIPAKVGYLHSDAKKVEAWRQRLGPKVKPRIGLTWSGNPLVAANRKRHFALSSFVPHLPPGVDYFCLQTEIVAADQETLAKTPGILQFRDSLHDFTDTAALCECMDLVISVDTSVAHLSGALGKKTWVLLPFVADWRWLTDREDSPWYPTLRLFRQKSLGDWTGVFERVSAELRQEPG